MTGPISQGLRVGYFLSTEEYSPDQLVEQAVLAEEAGFDALWISDHFHPWSDAQGHSPFVWSVIGAISQRCALPVTTAVTCPIMRISPVVVAGFLGWDSLYPVGEFPGDMLAFWLVVAAGGAIACVAALRPAFRS